MTPRAGTLGREAERAYWRHRANRRVRKRRRLQVVLRGTGALVLHFLALGLLAVSLRGLVQQARKSAEFRVRAIEFEGVDAERAAALEARLAGFLGQNIWSVDLGALARRVKEEPWVRGCTVRRRLPGTLRIRVEPRRPRAIALLELGPQFVDGEGALLGPAATSATLPRLGGLTRLPAPARNRALERGLSALERLEAEGAWNGTPLELDLGYPDRIVVRTGADHPPLLLDPERPEQNLRAYLALQAEIGSRVGPSEYVDLRWEGRIAVMPWTEAVTENHIAEGR